MEEPLQEFPNDVAFLRFDSFKSTVTSDDIPSSPPVVSPCKCNCSAAKRPYPEPTAERFPKKPNHNPDTPRNFSGFSLSPAPTLRRCVSDPYTPPRSLNSGFSVISLAPVPTQSLCSVPDPYTPPRSPNSHQFHSLVPQSNGFSNFTPNAPQLPPKLPVFPTPSPEKTFSRSSSSNKIITEESPNFQRWQRMKDRLKEMNEWLHEMREGEELKVTETVDPVQEDDVLLPNGEEGGGGIEKAVWVEKTGECLTLHFKCPCGKGYQILLADGQCYYKLV